MSSNRTFVYKKSDTFKTYFKRNVDALDDTIASSRSVQADWSRKVGTKELYIDQELIEEATAREVIDAHFSEKIADYINKHFHQGGFSNLAEGYYKHSIFLKTGIIIDTKALEEEKEDHQEEEKEDHHQRSKFFINSNKSVYFINYFDITSYVDQKDPLTRHHAETASNHIAKILTVSHISYDEATDRIQHKLISHKVYALDQASCRVFFNAADPAIDKRYFDSPETITSEIETEFFFFSFAKLQEKINRCEQSFKRKNILEAINALTNLLSTNYLCLEDLHSLKSMTGQLLDVVNYQTSGMLNSQLRSRQYEKNQELEYDLTETESQGNRREINRENYLLTQKEKDQIEEKFPHRDIADHIISTAAFKNLSRLFRELNNKITLLEKQAEPPSFFKRNLKTILGYAAIASITAVVILACAIPPVGLGIAGGVAAVAGIVGIKLAASIPLAIASVGILGGLAAIGLTAITGIKHVWNSLKNNKKQNETLVEASTTPSFNQTDLLRKMPKKSEPSNAENNAMDRISDDSLDHDWDEEKSSQENKAPEKPSSSSPKKP